MVTFIRLRTTPIQPTADHLNGALLHPLVLAVDVKYNHNSATRSSFVVTLGRGTTIFAILEFLGSPSDSPQLVAIEGRLPELLYGHDGRTIRSQEELNLALTRLKWLVVPFVGAEHAHLVLPGLHPKNACYIEKLGLALQLYDPKRAIFLASPFSRVHKSIEAAILTAGRTNTLPGPSATWVISDRTAEPHQGKISGGGTSCTKIECVIADPVILTRAARVVHFDRKTPASIPFKLLFTLYRYVVSSTLRGALGKAQRVPARGLRQAEVQVLHCMWEPSALHAALRLQAAFQSDAGKEELYTQVFGALSRQYSTCLEELIGDRLPLHHMREIEQADQEAEHARGIRDLGFPTGSDPEVEAVFSGVLVQDSKNPSKKQFNACRG